MADKVHKSLVIDEKVWNDATEMAKKTHRRYTSVYIEYAVAQQVRRDASLLARQKAVDPNG